MALNWIVPSRRVVIANDWEDYREVARSWVCQLDEYKSVLTTWYSPLVDASTDLPEGMEKALGTVRDWFSGNFGESVNCAPSETVTQTNTADEAAEPGFPTAEGGEIETTIVPPPSFAPRLWKGPLRVLLEPDDQAAPSDSTTGQAFHPEPLEFNGENIAIRLTERRELADAEVKLLPGDVLEFPIFKVMELAGVIQFRDATFNRRGSFFLGTSVCDGEGQSPGGVRLHDNMMAMRFQLLLNAAIGAFSHRGAVFSPDTDYDRRAHDHEFGNSRISARGMVYGGSLANPLRDGDDRFWLHTNLWGGGADDRTAKFLPMAPGLAQYPNGGRGEAGRLTWGWSCTPCTAALACHMVNTRDQNAYGDGVNGQAWARTDLASHPFLRLSRGADFLSAWMPDHIHENLVSQYSDAPDSASKTWVRHRAVRRIFESVEQATVLVPDEINLNAERASEDDGDDSPDTEAYISSLCPPPAQQAASEPVIPDTEESNTDPENDSAATSTNEDTELDGEGPFSDTEEDEDPEPEPEEEEEETPPERYLPPHEPVEIPPAYLQPLWSSLVVSGHEYSIVCVWPPSKMMDELDQDIGSTQDGPPLTGLITAYDPLSGESYYRPQDEGAADTTGDTAAPTAEATDGTDDLAQQTTEINHCSYYLFEASGTLRRTWIRDQAHPEYNISTFAAKPFRWKHINRFTLIRQTSRHYDEYKIGEDDHVRSRSLLGIVRFDKDGLLEVFENPSEYYPISFHNANDGMEDAMRNVWYPNRAVPFPTLEETNAHEIYRAFSSVRHNMQIARNTIDGLLANDSYLRRLIEHNAVYHGSYRNELRRLENEFLREHNRAARAARQADNVIRRLENQRRRNNLPYETTDSAFSSEVSRVGNEIEQLERERDASAEYQQVLRLQADFARAERDFVARRRLFLSTNIASLSSQERRRFQSENQRISQRWRQTNQSHSHARAQWRQGTGAQYERRLRELRRNTAYRLAQARRDARGDTRLMRRNEIPDARHARMRQEAFQTAMRSTRTRLAQIRDDLA